MPSIDTVDSIEINASPETLFPIILDSPRMREWYPRCCVDVIGGGDVEVGVHLRHVLSPPGSPIKSRTGANTPNPKRSCQNTTYRWC
jgi:hypothetical protein